VAQSLFPKRLPQRPGNTRTYYHRPRLKRIPILASTAITRSVPLSPIVVPHHTYHSLPNIQPRKARRNPPSGKSNSNDGRIHSSPLPYSAPPLSDLLTQSITYPELPQSQSRIHCRSPTSACRWKRTETPIRF
jgi:hypothetical protein